MASPTIISEVDSKYVQYYHSSKGRYELLHMCWAQIFSTSFKGKAGSPKSSDRLLVLTQLRLLVVKPKAFGVKRVVEREFMLTGLRKAKMRGLNNFFEITMILEDEEELVIVTRVKEDCEKFCKGIVQAVGILSQVVPSYRATIDFPEDIRRNSGAPAQVDNVRKVEFSYRLHCAFAEVIQKDAIVTNLVKAIQSDSRIFQPFEMLDGSRDHKNDINVIVNCVQNVDCLSTVRVDGVSIRSDTLREIGKLVVTNDFLIDVELTNCSLTKDSLSSFTTPFDGAKRRPLRLLNFSQNNLANVGECMQHLRSVEVQRLDVSDCKLNKKAISKGLLPLLMSKNWLAEGGLRMLSLSFNNLGSRGSQELVPFLKSTECLEELDLIESGTELTEVLQAIWSNQILVNTKLRVLDISQNKMTAFGAVALADLLGSSKCIQSVNLRETRLDKSTFEHIISKIPRNTTGTEIDIDFSDNKLGNYAAEVFSSLKGMGDALVSLALASNSLGESKDFDAIMSCLSSARNLRSLNLDFNFKANKKQAHLTKIKALARCVEKLPKLEQLSMVGDKPNQRLALTGVELVPIAELLSSKKSLRVLNIAGNRLQDESVKTLSDGLMVNTTLKFINIEDNKLTFENMQTIVGSIQQSSQLLGTLPNGTFNRLWNEKKRNRETIDAWVDRLNKIFHQNLEKEQKIQEEKEDVPQLSVIPGYNGYYPPVNSAPGSYIPSKVRKRLSQQIPRSSADDGIIKNDLSPNSSNNLQTTTTDGEGSALAVEGMASAPEDEKVWEVPMENTQLEEGQSRVKYPSFKPQGNALALALLLKNASSSPLRTYQERKEGEVTLNNAKSYSQSQEKPLDEIIILDEPGSSKEGNPANKGPCVVGSPEVSIPLPPPIPFGQEPAKPKTSDELRRSNGKTPSRPLKFKSDERNEKTSAKRKAPRSLRNRVAQFEKMQVMGVRPLAMSPKKPKSARLNRNVKPMPMHMPSLGTTKSMPFPHSHIVFTRLDDEKKSQQGEKVDVSKIIASRPKITGKTNRRKRTRKRGKLRKKE